MESVRSRRFEEIAIHVLSLFSVFPLEPSETSLTLTQKSKADVPTLLNNQASIRYDRDQTKQRPAQTLTGKYESGEHFGKINISRLSYLPLSNILVAVPQNKSWEILCQSRHRVKCDALGPDLFFFFLSFLSSPPLSASLSLCPRARAKIEGRKSMTTNC